MSVAKKRRTLAKLSTYAASLIRINKEASVLPDNRRERELVWVQSAFDFVGEVRRIVEAAASRNVTLRALGAVAFRIHCPGHLDLHAATGRGISDIDLAGYKKQGSEICDVMAQLGYELDKTMLLQEDRYFFADKSKDVKADVFLDKLEMCHTIDFSHRLHLDSPTVPLEELLLEKLQIVNIESKDIIDVAMLLSEHSVGSGQEGVDKAYIAGLLAADWGFYHTVSVNLQKITDTVGEMQGIQQSDRDRVLGNIKLLAAEIESHPKSLGWKARARVGTRRKWFNDVSTPDLPY
jgi:hypothetical protein